MSSVEKDKDRRKGEGYAGRHLRSRRKVYASCESFDQTCVQPLQHALPVFQNLEQYGETFPNATDYCARTFSLPMHPYLQEKEQREVINAVLEAL